MNLKEFFQKNPRVAVAFSGGVDSAYLLYAAKKYGAQVKAYYVKTQFQPLFELTDALRLAREIGADMEIIEEDILSEEIASNPADRCYYCKRRIFGVILERARQDSYETLLDGTNASDDAGDRPGMRAIAELSVKSPLRECGLTKEEIRRRSNDAGLFTWDKPSYACLATRIPSGERISEDMLTRIEISENRLSGLGFTDFRVRVSEGKAKLQFPLSQLEKALERKQEILTEMKPFFQNAVIDLNGR